MPLTQQQLVLYSRQLLLAEIDSKKQAQLLEHKITVSKEAEPQIKEIFEAYVTRAGIQICDIEGETVHLPSSCQLQNMLTEAMMQKKHFHVSSVKNLLGAFLATEYIKKRLQLPYNLSLEHFAKHL